MPIPDLRHDARLHALPLLCPAANASVFKKLRGRDDQSWAGTSCPGHIGMPLFAAWRNKLLNSAAVLACPTRCCARTFAACNGDKQRRLPLLPIMGPALCAAKAVVVPVAISSAGAARSSQATAGAGIQTLIRRWRISRPSLARWSAITPPVAGRLVHLHRQLGDLVKVGEAFDHHGLSPISRSLGR